MKVAHKHVLWHITNNQYYDVLIVFVWMCVGVTKLRMSTNVCLYAYGLPCVAYGKAKG